MNNGESPTIRIVLGEFDELKEDDVEELYINLGDDLLLSKEKSKDQSVPVEVFNISEFVT